MSLNIFESTFLQFTALLSFPDLLLLTGRKEVSCKHWERDEETGSLSRELEFLALVPGGVDMYQVRMTQSYHLQVNQLVLTCASVYPDFTPLANTAVEQIWRLTEISPEQSTLRISLRFSTKFIKPDSDLSRALESDTKYLAETWFSTAQARNLFPQSSLSTHNLARYEEVDLRDFAPVPKTQKSQSWMLVYVNSLLLVVVLWYLVKLQGEIEERLREPGCRSEL
jgi:hypothetical protein